MSIFVILPLARCPSFCSIFSAFLCELRFLLSVATSAKTQKKRLEKSAGGGKICEMILQKKRCGGESGAAVVLEWKQSTSNNFTANDAHKYIRRSLRRSRGG